MRISDWSSDVCSSDLLLDAVEQVLDQRMPQPLALAADAARTRDYDWASGVGRFVDGPAVLLDNQQRDERPGVRVYRVFQPAATGAAPLLVELGWLPLPGDRDRKSTRLHSRH